MIDFNRPLDKISSIKLKLSIIIVAAIGVTVFATTAGFYLSIKPRWSIMAAVILALLMVQVLARGTTSRLRQMANSAEAIARGDYSVAADLADMGADEVGQLGRSLNRLAADLEDLDRQRQELIANVSHELRTPLTAIHGHLENLADGVTDLSDQTVQAMLSQTDRLNRLVQDLLNISRLDAGQTHLDVQKLPIAGLLTEIAQATELRSPTPRVIVEAPADLLVLGDPDRLRQVFRNLVDNAHRYSPADRPVVITASSDGSPSGYRWPTKDQESQSANANVSSSASIGLESIGLPRPAAPASAWRSLAALSMRTADLSTPKMSSPTAAAWWSCFRSPSPGLLSPTNQSF